MSAQELKAARTTKGLTQTAAAARLGVSQAYVAMLENGTRRLTRRLAARVMKLYGLPPTTLPPSGSLTTRHQAELAHDLAALGYPGLAYLRPTRRNVKNPTEVLLAALANDDLESRLVEALPWLMLNYASFDRAWLVREAKLRDLQNRVGYVAALARRLAERAGATEKVQALNELETGLQRSVLAQEDTLCKAPASEAERKWLRRNQSDEAKRWNVLTDWTADVLRYA